MDARRLLTLALSGLALCGCATLRPPPAAGAAARPAGAAPAVSPAPAAPRPAAVAAMAPIPNPPEPGDAAQGGRPSGARAPGEEEAPAAAFPGDRRVGSVRVFAYAPGRVYEVRAAPLRVTVLTLGPGETVVSKAAGDTVRWQIGETTSGAGEGQRAHVLLKPLQRGLETNLVLATSQRVYLVRLRSGGPEAFDPAVAWDLGAVRGPAPAAAAAPASGPPSPAPGPLDGGYRIAPLGKRPAWTPLSAFNDGTRTFILLPPKAARGEAPALFVLGPGGEPQLANYRQHGAVLVADRVFDRAELRLGGRRAQAVRITRLAGDGP